MGQRRNDKGKFNNALRLKKMKNNISKLKRNSQKSGHREIYSCRLVYNKKEQNFKSIT
jgi:hypothetical protein